MLKSAMFKREKGTKAAVFFISGNSNFHLLFLVFKTDQPFWCSLLHYNMTCGIATLAPSPLGTLRSMNECERLESISDSQNRREKLSLSLIFLLPCASRCCGDSLSLFSLHVSPYLELLGFFIDNARYIHYDAVFIWLFVDNDNAAQCHQ